MASPLLLRALRFPAPLALCLFFSAGCGGDSSPTEQADAAQTALSKGDYAEAQSQAEAGLKAAGIADKTLSWKLERIRVESIAKQGQAPEVVSSMERLSASYPAQCDASIYSKVAGYLAQAGQGVAAVDVAHAGQQKFPDRKADFDGLIEELKLASAGDAELTAKLKSLGYL